jgi:hypothetical protein
MVGNDDSGPEDALDDLDLECESPPLFFYDENTALSLHNYLPRNASQLQRCCTA